MATVFIGFPSGALPACEFGSQLTLSTPECDSQLRLQSYLRPLVWSAHAPGHDGSRARGANRDSGLSGHRSQQAFPRAGPSRFAISVMCRAASGELVRDAGQTAGTAAKSLPFRQTAHAIRANLLARATAALLWPRRRSTCNAHVRNRSVAGAVFDFA
jgi:hypothetical protein